MKIYYIQGSSVNLREKPDLESKVIIRLAIGNPVEVTGKENGWCHVHDPYQGWIGWVWAEYVDTIQPTFKGVWAKYKKAGKNDLKEQIKWLERANALEPTDLKILELLGQLYKRTGNQEQLEWAKKSLALIKNPDLLRDPDEPMVVLVESKNYLEPLAYIVDDDFKDVWTNQDELDGFIKKFYQAGRRYVLFNQNGIAGSATIKHSVLPGSINMEGCTMPVIADVATKFNDKKVPSDSFFIATNEPKRIRKSGPIQKASRKEAKQLEQISKKSILEEKNYDEAMDSQSLQVSSTVYSVDIDNDNSEELVGVVLFHLPSEQKDSYHDFNRFSLIVAKKDKKGRYRKLFVNNMGSSGDAGVYHLKILSLIDLNGDGNLEMIVSVSGYEFSSLLVFPFKNHTYEKSGIGTSSGC